MKQKKQKELELKIQKLFSEVMRAIGCVFLFAFSMIGAITYYSETTASQIIRLGGGYDIRVLFIASVVVIMCFAMTQVKDKW